MNLPRIDRSSGGPARLTLLVAVAALALPSGASAGTELERGGPPSGGWTCAYIAAHPAEAAAARISCGSKIGWRFVPAPPTLVAQCRATARAVGYAAPCPLRIPAGLAATQPTARCALDIVGPAGRGGCGGRIWSGWIVGSSAVFEQHLAITAAPTVIEDGARLVNGPGWVRGMHVRPLGTLRVNGWHVRAVFVPPASNGGSAFSGHVVLIWTARGRTYGVGFHDIDGVQKTLALGTQLLRSLALVAP